MLESHASGRPPAEHGPGGLQNCPSTAQYTPKMPPHGRRKADGFSKTAPRQPTVALRSAQDARDGFDGSPGKPPRWPRIPSRWPQMSPRRHVPGWPSTKLHHLPRPSSPPPPSPRSPSCSYFSSSSSRLLSCLHQRRYRTSPGKERASRIACTVPFVNTPDNINNVHERYYARRRLAASLAHHHSQTILG